MERLDRDDDISSPGIRRPRAIAWRRFRPRPAWALHGDGGQRLPLQTFSVLLPVFADRRRDTRPTAPGAQRGHPRLWAWLTVSCLMGVTKADRGTAPEPRRACSREEGLHRGADRLGVCPTDPGILPAAAPPSRATLAHGRPGLKANVARPARVFCIRNAVLRRVLDLFQSARITGVTIAVRASCCRAFGAAGQAPSSAGFLSPDKKPAAGIHDDEV